ncbi:SulP family inorganic anion transporter [Bradyrhizobium sp. STM 3562]|uniref:SulP family inorganic anion transporter n=1 Tax=Bradyrhizobium sp. STM 3562 TaxID=578924 RepID=UPI00388F1DD5
MANSHTAQTSETSWPVFRSLRAYRPSDLPGDLIAGLTLAAIAIPEQMATARLGGFAPQIGFLAFVAGSLGFALLGGNRFLSAGADSTITPIFAGGLALLAASTSPHYLPLAMALALLVGLFLILSGLFRLGGIANLLSTPVTVGFLAGIALHILVSQIPGVLGLPSPDGPMLERIAVLALEAPKANAYTLGIGLGVFAIVTASEALSAKIPGALIGLIAATIAVIAGSLESKGVKVVGSVPATWPTPSLPDIDPEQWAKLVPLSLLIAIVVMVQTSAVTRAFPSEPGKPADVDRDFLGVGAGSVVAGLFGAFPVNSSPPRTGIVAETGGRTQASGLVAATIVLVLSVFGGTLLKHVPNAALGGVLLFVGLRIIRFRQIVLIFRESLPEFFLVIATAAAIIVLPIEQGVAIGIGLSLLHGIWSSTRARLVVFERVPGTTIWWPTSPHISGERIPGVLVVGLQAPLSFLNASTFHTDLFHMLHASKPHLLVLEAASTPEIDFTAAQLLLDLFTECRKLGITVAIARLESLRAQDAFERFGLYDVLPRDHIFRSVDEAVKELGQPAANSSP